METVVQLSLPYIHKRNAEKWAIHTFFKPFLDGAVSVVKKLYLSVVSYSEASRSKDFETRGLHSSYLPIFLQVLKKFG